MNEALQNDIRRRRRQQNLTQQELAKRIGITRQALSAVERGRSSPSTTMTLHLARELGCQVEELFWIDGIVDEASALTASLAAGNDEAPEESPVMVGRVDSRWIAHPISPRNQAFSASSPDGCISSTAAERAAPDSVELELFGPTKELVGNVVVAGCAPALRELEVQTARHDRGRARWLPCPSLRAAELLARGEVHMAGLHVVDSSGEDYNRELVRQTLEASTMEMVTLLHWRAGLIVGPGNPLGIKGLQDLLGKDLRFVGREPDSGAHISLVRWLRQARKEPDELRVHTRASSHYEVALAIDYGAADVGVGLESVARALGLGFLPLTEERFDLVFPEMLRREGVVTPILETLNSGTFRRSIAAICGHDASHTGSKVAL